MNKQVQNVSISVGDCMTSLEVSNPDHTPSWKRYGPGSAYFKAQAHHKGVWVQLVMIESSHAGRGVSRQTMITLERDAAVALRDMLNKTFPVEA